MPQNAALADQSTPFKGVAADLLAQIEAGTLLPGDKLLSTAKLAAHYAVAVPTAHRALADLAKRGYLLRKAGVGTFVAVPEPSARSEGVGIVVRCDGHLWGDFADSLLRGLGQREAQATTVNVGDLAVEQILRQPAFLHLLDCCPRTVIVQHTRVGEHILARVPDAHVITLDSNAGSGNLDQVIPDYEQAGAMAGQYLIDRGHRRIDLAGIFTDERGPYRPTPELRVMCAGLNGVLERAGLAPTRLVDIKADSDADDRLTNYLQSADRASALICSFAHRSAQIMRLARAIGLDVPGEMALVSAMDTPWTVAYEITSLDAGYRQAGELCIELMDERAAMAADSIRHRRCYKVAPRLIERRTT